MPTQRQLRVNNLLQREISDIVRRDVDDPDIGLVTITGVEVSVDLSHAKVFASVLGDEDSKRDTIRALIRARKFVRKHLRERLTMRRIPKLSFHLDETAQRAQHMEELLKHIADERDDDDERAE